jgi:aryl-alcohol dehydrogenase-like predicted oxidoreductase
MSDNNLERLILGTANFGGGYGLANSNTQFSNEQISEILSTAYLLGINRLDTAMAYGDAESAIGRFDSGCFKCITKVSLVNAESGNFGSKLISMVTNSLIRIGTHQIYGLLLHFPPQLFRSEGREIYDGLLRLKSEGIVKKIGCSVYEIDELDLIINNYDIDMVQLPFNILDQRFEESGWINELSSRGIEIHVRSVFLQGLLLMSPEIQPTWIKGHNQALIEWHDYLQEVEVDPVEVCMKYVLKNEAISGVVVGVDSANQVAELVKVCRSADFEINFKPSEIDKHLVDPRLWKKN